MSSPFPCRLLVFAGCAGLLRAAPSESRIEALFRPPLGEQVALSPDGERLAYTLRQGRDLAIALMSVEPPGPRRKTAVEPERDPASPDDPPVQLRFLRWATPHRLVFAPVERIRPLPPVIGPDGTPRPNPDGPAVISPIVAVDGDGRHRATLVDASHFQETPAEARRSLADLLRTTQELAATRSDSVRWRMPHVHILGFLPSDREQLVIETRGAYSIPAQHLVDIRTGTLRAFGGEWTPPPGGAQVFDSLRHTVVGERRPPPQSGIAWRDEELGRIERELETRFPRRVVEILDWNLARSRVLARVTGGSDPGRVFVYQRPENLVLEVLSLAPWLAPATLHPTRAFACDGPGGRPVSGYVTFPRRRERPPPLVVVFPRDTRGAISAFDPEAQILADLGLAVARLNTSPGYEASAGPLRPEPADRGLADEAQAVVEWLAGRREGPRIDRMRVVSLGHEAGGRRALRALELRPQVFRCAVAFDPPAPASDPGGAEERIPRACVFVGSATRETAEATGGAAGRGERHGLAAGFSAGQPAARAAAYRTLEQFLSRELATGRGERP